MHFLTLVAGIVLLSKAETLKCYVCAPGLFESCSNKTMQCASERQQCAAQRIIIYEGVMRFDNLYSKTCLLAEDCVESSVNYGTIRTAVTTRCCSSDLCNTQHAPDDSKPTPNGKKCFRCLGEQCATTLNCQGGEDHCISTTGGKVVKGCASKKVCTSKQFAQVAAGAEISCCQGDFCNSASSSSAGVLLLLMSVALFS
ncbi:urokinase plasminogen activator surface receptor-like [Parambassis ranga]|uniref:Urokinase plasminogen activator surface receptor-like n=1 Tax=Parambassis ranga TaxID=210632 RepID=A0A6P7JZZ0_9TELE|nr:urokinase plasminogen activator surface receptor-like [Parambassis ranga]